MSDLGCDHPAVALPALILLAFGVPLTVFVLGAVDPRAMARKAAGRYIDQRIRRAVGEEERPWNRRARRFTSFVTRHRGILWLGVVVYWLAAVVSLAEVVVLRGSPQVQRV